MVSVRCARIKFTSPVRRPFEYDVPMCTSHNGTTMQTQHRGMNKTYIFLVGPMHAV